jgi:hypothetical protein
MLKSPINRLGLVMTGAHGPGAHPGRPRPEPTLTFHGAARMLGRDRGQNPHEPALAGTSRPHKQRYQERERRRR